ncbi:exopolysaccharide biosynthesis polyprenyl glycosylphosphotransferase [Streptomyces sp. SKN60]|uniref:exopolysaccharide biosynthesis polyprenyl glycosylphosphotransferase n=1 Tax=Streptomyces sp. SKN60 TaxID=2855506 RepID=UPI0022482B5C|nr:exopolysaccharide biosynthesis polyprenyl glycosylphosphotransferase [Streptomyces sp. SKN60]MCX2184956.1 exopolysaccharide biosynthesis polyprenyl glycosylphosphotransferase [Streptomyces sp. SKN60]
MTTESTSVNPSPGPWPVAGQFSGLASLASPASPRTASDRLALPVRRPLRERYAAVPLVAADVLAVLLAVGVLSAAHRRWELALPVVLLVVALDARAGLHRPAALPAGVLDEVPALAARAGIAWCVTAAAVAAYAPALVIGPLRLCAAYAVQVTAVFVVRGLVLARRRRTARTHPRSALVVGAAGPARRFAAALAQHPEYGVRPVGIVAPRADGEPGLPVLTTTEEVHRAVIQNTVRDAVLVSSDAADEGLVTLFQQHGCATWRVGGEQSGGPMGDHLWGYGCRRLVPLGERRGLTAKRALDVALAGPALALALPVLMACALAVRIADGPGVLFRQERVGQNGRLFTLLKFRTLKPADETESATQWSIANDRRMSPAGHFLRKTSLDELPQLWNVLRGDMSLVGPRPERPYFVAQFSRIHAGYAARHRMPVGLTGLAQVHGLRGDTSIEDRCRFDNHYIDHWSLWQDVCILLRTAAGLVRPTGS